MLNKNAKVALKNWKNNEMTEFSEAPILVRVAGLAVVTVSTVLALVA
jgi:hypothetical protein